MNAAQLGASILAHGHRILIRRENGIYWGKYWWLGSIASAATTTVVDFTATTQRIGYHAVTTAQPNYGLYLDRMVNLAAPAVGEQTDVLRSVANLQIVQTRGGETVDIQGVGHTGGYSSYGGGISNDTTAAAIVYTRAGVTRLPDMMVDLERPFLANLNTDVFTLAPAGTAVTTTSAVPLIVGGSGAYVPIGILDAMPCCTDCAIPQAVVDEMNKRPGMLQYARN